MSRFAARCLRASPEVMAQRVRDEVVLLDLRTDQYFGLDAVGARLWELVVAGHDIEAIRDRMLEEYDVPTATLEADMDQWIASLIEAGLLDEVAAGEGGHS